LNLFSKFKETLDEDNSIDEEYSIDKEIGYLVLIKDILDELNILKSLIKDQKKVWHDAFSEYTMEIKSLAKDAKKGWHDAFSEYTMEKDYVNSREPGEILEMLEEMITDATRVERSVRPNASCSMAILPLTNSDKRSSGSKAEASQPIRSAIITQTSRRNDNARHYTYGVYYCYHCLRELSQHKLVNLR
jgi:hypothetical protein